MVSPDSAPLQGILGDEVAEVYRELHREHGVDLLLGQDVSAFRGEASVRAVETTEGRVVEGDLVVVGIGAEPRIELAAEAGLGIGSGILVDERLESSVPGIFAAGDVAEAWHPALGVRLRVEHWDNAKRQGRHAARSMLGMAEPYLRLPYFYSDQYDLGMEYRGYAPTWDRVAFRGSPDAREFIAFWLADGRVVAAMNANVWKVAKPLSALIEGRAVVPVAATGGRPRHRARRARSVASAAGCPAVGSVEDDAAAVRLGRQLGIQLGVAEPRRHALGPGRVHRARQLAVACRKRAIRTVPETDVAADLVRPGFVAGAPEHAHEGRRQPPMTRSRTGLPSCLCPNFPALGSGDLVEGPGPLCPVGPPQSVTEQARHGRVVALGHGDGDLAIDSTVQLGRAAGTGPSTLASAPVLGPQQAGRHQTVEVEGSQLAADADGRRSLISPDGGIAHGDEVVQTPPVEIAEQGHCADRVLEPPFAVHDVQSINNGC